ncbi:NnrU family protein [bacterium]|nr:NnrU family protein [bacterium]
MGIWMVLLGWILFAGTHIGLSAEPFRGSLVSKLGDKGFQGVYSLVALASFAFLIISYSMARGDSVLFLEAGMESQWMGVLSNLIMLLAFILLFSGFINGTPMGMAPGRREAYGITRITRHPMNMSFALFGLAHLLTNRLAVDWIFYLGFILYGYLGSAHQDKKKVSQMGDELAVFVNSTSIIPFAGLIAGKQKLKLGEISKLAILLGIVFTVIARVLHPALRSQLF